jgi:Flp pilus assembly protein TadD
MIRRLNTRPAWVTASAALIALAIALPAAAQSTGMVRGVVQDASGRPVDGAKVNIDADESKRHFETKTNKRGEFIRIGLVPGMYRVAAEKGTLASSTESIKVSIVTGPPLTLVLGAGGAPLSPEAAARLTELNQVFAEGVEASRAGNHDEAIARFMQASEIKPNCFDCLYNLAFSQAQKKDYDAAEASYKKAIEMKPDYSEAYIGLANIYNVTRKFDLAAEASAKAIELSGAGAAAGGGNADAMFSQGVILWNAGKIPEAKKQFEAALAVNPSHAESHFQLGMALVNEGNLAAAGAEFETYLNLAPTGPNAAAATGILGSLKK